ncbi:ABC transporter permease [Enterobacteriaceae bacterium YMB-R22]|uniref:ABC transporter permease n=1 Tax=Tenebrionicola larvae TaxID=2815733 RepID=UPI0020130D56|nr:ABC transporter permease [Tenebrionicola larvae]MBV4411936.1 ABC transporter permease [Tenebrionicola larvae]
MGIFTGLSLLSNKRIILAVSLLLFIIAIALLAPWLSPHPPNAQNLQAALIPPVWEREGTWHYPLGTTILGECILSRLLYATRTAIEISLPAAAGCAIVGITPGILAGYFRGRTEKIVLASIELWMSFPAVVLSLLIVIVLSPGIASMVIAIVLIDWTRFCRVIHSKVSQLNARQFIIVARSLGATHRQIIINDIFPHLLKDIVMLFSIEMAVAVVVESTVSFIGVSVNPENPSWGALLAQGLDYAYSAPWVFIQPALCIISFVLICTLFSDGFSQNPAND